MVVARRVLELLDRLERGESLTVARTMKLLGIQEPAARRYLKLLEKRGRACAEPVNGEVRYRSPSKLASSEDHTRSTALELALQGLAWLEGTKYHAALAVLRREVAACGDVDRGDRIARGVHHLSPRPVADRKKYRNAVTALLGSLEERRVCAIDYTTLDGRTGKYRIAPHRLVIHDGLVVVLARKLPSEEVRLFELEGIQRIQMLEDTFTLASSTEIPERILDDSFGIYIHEGPVEDVRLSVRGEVRASLERRPVHRTQSLGPDRRGWREVGFRVVLARPLHRAILSWIPDVRVIAPNTLREAIAQQVDALRREG